ncbi:MAG: alpha-amylase family glycosyl hydrolase [Patescibacteria group bacterium]
MNQEKINLSYIPDWTFSSIIYQIYALGFCDCPAVNPITKPESTISQIQPVNRLNKIRHYYSHLTKLGINTVIIGPVFESCTHGYDVIDYFQVDRRLGTNQLLHEIIDELHQQKIKVILDITINHTSRLFPAFLDIKNQQKTSPYIDWYQDINFNQDTVWKDGFSYAYWKNIVELPILNLDQPSVKKYIFNVAQFWLKNYHIDGWRLDVAYDIPPQFWQEFRQVCKDINPHCLLIGELVEQDYNQWINPTTLDTGTNYQLFQHILGAFNQKDFWQLTEIINYEKHPQSGKYNHILLANFVGNHDTNRIYNQIYQPDYLEQIFTFLFTHPGLPCIYYGDEILLNGEKHPIHDFHIRQSMPNLNHLTQSQSEFLHHIQKLIKIRHQNPELTTGEITILHTSSSLLLIGIQTTNNYYLNLLNLDPRELPSTLHINTTNTWTGNSTFTNLLSPDQHFHCHNQQLQLPKQPTILKLES